MIGTAGEATRVEQVMALVRERIERRVLSPGARLTSVRAMAEATLDRACGRAVSMGLPGWVQPIPPVHASRLALGEKSRNPLPRIRRQSFVLE